MLMIYTRLNPSAPLSKSVSLGQTDTLKLILTTTDDKTAKRPHQAFLTLTEPETGLEESFIFTVKESGKAKVDLVGYMHQLQRTTLTYPDSEGPPLPVPHLLEANRRLHRHRLFRILRPL